MRDVCERYIISVHNSLDNMTKTFNESVFVITELQAVAAGYRNLKDKKKKKKQKIN